MLSLKRDTREHGEAFVYQTPKADVVNWTTNRATKRSFEEDMHESLWGKLATSGETYVLLDRNGNLFAGGGLTATPNNLARFATMMLNEGQFNGQQVVPKSVLAKLIVGNDKALFMKSADAQGVYGDGHWIKESYSAIGINGQWIFIDPYRNVAVIKRSSQPESYASYYDDYTVNVFDAVVKHLSGK